MAVIAGLFAASLLWYGVRYLFAAMIAAQWGVLDLPRLIIGGIDALAGGLFALTAGSLLETPPRLPERPLAFMWVVVVFTVVLCIVVSRRIVSESEEARHRKAVTAQARWLLLGVAATMAGLMLSGYVRAF